MIDTAGLVHFVVFGREAGDDVGADRDVRDGAAFSRRDKVDCIGARMAALHALEDQIVAVLQRQVEVRHQARFGGEQFEQFLVDLDPVERGHAQACELLEQCPALRAPASRASASRAGRAP